MGGLAQPPRWNIRWHQWDRERQHILCIPRLVRGSPGRLVERSKQARYGVQICMSHIMYASPRGYFLVDTPSLIGCSLSLQSPDGKRIALSSESGQVFIFDLESGSLTTSYTSHAMAVRSLAWSYDGHVSIILCFGFTPFQLRHLAVTSHSVG